MKLEELKNQYNALKKKHGLPEFSELNENFEIERIEKDTDFLLREIKKAMMEKIIGYIRFIEIVINPSQAPPMFMLFTKTINESERKNINEIYKKLGNMEIKSLKAEIEYSEEENASLIKEFLRGWKELKPKLKNLIDLMEKNWNSQTEKKERGYFG